MGNMRPVAENKLQRMLAWRKLYRCFGLSFAEMAVLLIIWDGAGHIRQFGVDDQVVVTGIFHNFTGWRHGYSTDAEFDIYWRSYDFVIFWADDEYGGAGRCRRLLNAPRLTIRGSGFRLIAAAALQAPNQYKKEK
jgi:hypothetical protein